MGEAQQVRLSTAAKTALERRPRDEQPHDGAGLREGRKPIRAFSHHSSLKNLRTSFRDSCHVCTLLWLNLPPKVTSSPLPDDDWVLDTTTNGDLGPSSLTVRASLAASSLELPLAVSVHFPISAAGVQLSSGLLLPEIALEMARDPAPNTGPPTTDVKDPHSPSDPIGLQAPGISVWTGSKASIDLAKRWINECIANHASFRRDPPTFLPTRVHRTAKGNTAQYHTELDESSHPPRTGKAVLESSRVNIKKGLPLGHTRLAEPNKRQSTSDRILEALEPWYRLLHQYCKASVTRETDRLPAISALAKLVAEKSGLEYYAGMWGRGLAATDNRVKVDIRLEGLLWCVQKPLDSDRSNLPVNQDTDNGNNYGGGGHGDPPKLPVAKDVQSFTWASIGGPSDIGWPYLEYLNSAHGADIVPPAATAIGKGFVPLPVPYTSTHWNDDNPRFGGVISESEVQLLNTILVPRCFVGGRTGLGQGDTPPTGSSSAENAAEGMYYFPDRTVLFEPATHSALLVTVRRQDGLLVDFGLAVRFHGSNSTSKRLTRLGVFYEVYKPDGRHKSKPQEDLALL
ncbi:hypothetical protein MAPG_00050 [Magnaporthiopsis poae ATCC 64411]|uniref:Uncharacterized protein n=1 Tax=Magnaporthiopsis poae (strain ATCC 64411 / 73-15) TaxID=644358 RepID=A0A0C4DJZ0_MAGP6|nr:hypothetical protein MAPG_00050 [Magnaporthiopsis poae ATCC 64411]